jgi:hypothetical protein
MGRNDNRVSAGTGCLAPAELVQHLMDMGYRVELESYVAPRLDQGPQGYLSNKWSAASLTQHIESGIALANVYCEPPA